MSATEVAALVRSVIVHFGLPFAVLSVVESPAVWNIQVRSGTGGVVRFSVFGGQPVAMRAAIHQFSVFGGQPVAMRAAIHQKLEAAL